MKEHWESVQNASGGWAHALLLTLSYITKMSEFGSLAKGSFRHVPRWVDVGAGFHSPLFPSAGLPQWNFQVVFLPSDSALDLRLDLSFHCLVPTSMEITFERPLWSYSMILCLFICLFVSTDHFFGGKCKINEIGRECYYGTLSTVCFCFCFLTLILNTAVSGCLVVIQWIH